MKKLFSVFMLLLATVFATNALAQQHVYINDKFPQGKPSQEYWNRNKISNIGSITIGGNPWPAWFYDANGDIFGKGNEDTAKVQGLYIVESNPFRVDETGEMFLNMDLYVVTKKASVMRNFGARIRLNSGTEWDTIFALREEGATLPAYTMGSEGKVAAPIGDKYNGKAVVVQIFFYNDSLADDAFIMAFNNFSLATYGSEPMVQTELVSPLFASGEVYHATLNCINQSTNPLTNIEYAYSVNGKAEKKQSVSFPDTLQGWGAAATVSLNLDIKEATLDTTNRILLWPVVVDGKAYVSQAGDTLDFLLTVADESLLDQDYIPMLECFTSATCNPCRTLNPYLNPALAELKEEGKLNVVKYQMNFPGTGDKYYIVGNATRGQYYGVEGVPTLVLNGQERPIPEDGSFYPNVVVSTLRDMVEDASQNKAFFSIKVNKAEVNADSMLVKLDFDVVSHIPGSMRATVHAMVIEGTTHGNKVVNVEKDFHYVNMKFATPASGRSSNFKQENLVNYTYTVDMKNTNVEEFSDLQVVIFVQDANDKYIYQSAGAKMGEGEPMAVEDEELAQVSIYPNPASHTVYVAGLEKAQVEIFDLGGRRVYEKTDADGVLEVSLASFAKGAYVVRIAQKGAVASRKLVVK
ncbi:MAG: T9SS type A sorting domain-containing protein [Bacteroidales bacterium]|nr:T9SS type A sorting domain-containing protein [Bacteroidales bacterium]